MAYANTPAQVANIKSATPATPKPYIKPAYPYAHLPMLTDADVPNTVLMRTLHRMLRTRRAGDSMAEARCVAWLVERLPVTMIDAAGNVHVDMRKGPMHRTMFTSHTDTVHHVGGPNNIRLDTSNPLAVKWRADEGHCLGADDGAGIALMVHMIDAGVPAYYIFFRGEESGGIGSSWLAENMAQCLKDVDRCISFDRADYADVITHQAGGRCCSDEFADALAQALTRDDFSLVYMPDNTGVFTDSANLTKHIAECTNLSVGYKSQHGDGEWQDVTFLQTLATALVNIAWDNLPVKRDPKEVEAYDRWGFPTQHPIYAADDAVSELLDALKDAIDGKYMDLRWMLAHHIADSLPDVMYDMDIDSIADKLKLSGISAVRYGLLYDCLAAGTLTNDDVLDKLQDIVCNV